MWMPPQVSLQSLDLRVPPSYVICNEGCLLYHYGLTEFNYYTVIFGVSRGLSTNVSAGVQNNLIIIDPLQHWAVSRRSYGLEVRNREK